MGRAFKAWRRARVGVSGGDECGCLEPGASGWQRAQRAGSSKAPPAAVELWGDVDTVLPGRTFSPHPACWAHATLFQVIDKDTSTQTTRGTDAPSSTGLFSVKWSLLCWPLCWRLMRLHGLLGHGAGPPGGLESRQARDRSDLWWGMPLCHWNPDPVPTTIDLRHRTKTREQLSVDLCGASTGCGKSLGGGLPCVGSKAGRGSADSGNGGRPMVRLRWAWKPLTPLIDTFQLLLPISLTFEMLFFSYAITSNA